MLGPDSDSPSGDFEEFATLAAAASGFTGVSRIIICKADGVLVVKQANGGTSRTLTVKAEQRYHINVAGITVAGSSGAAPIQVFR
jgi:hypothetical protein